MPVADPGVGAPLPDAAAATGSAADAGAAGVAVSEELAAGAVAPLPEVRFTMSVAPGRSDRAPPTPVPPATEAVLPSGATTETVEAAACDGAPETAAVVAREVGAAGVSAGAGSVAWFDFDQRAKRPSPNRWLCFAGAAACCVAWADGAGVTFDGARIAGRAFEGTAGGTTAGGASAWGVPEPVPSGMVGAIGNDGVGGVAIGSGSIGSGIVSIAPGAGAELGFGTGGRFSAGAGGTTGAVGAGA